MIFFVGGNSKLAKALQEDLSHYSVRVLPRSIYKNWWDCKSIREISHFFETNAKAGDIIIISSGILDPSTSNDDLLAINFLLPKNIIDAVKDLGIKIVTFGTIMEKLINKQNNYILSKNRLGRYVKKISQQSSLVTHFRLHTLYGNYEPEKFMFLGQIVNSIRSDSPFNMTKGRQLREYHHIKDDVSVLVDLIGSNTTGIVEVSHGEPIRLCELAEFVFAYFNKNYLLNIGNLPEPVDENFNKVQKKSMYLKRYFFRPSVAGVVDCLADLKILGDKQ